MGGAVWYVNPGDFRGTTPKEPSAETGNTEASSTLTVSKNSNQGNTAQTETSTTTEKKTVTEEPVVKNTETSPAPKSSPASENPSPQESVQIETPVVTEETTVSTEPPVTEPAVAENTATSELEVVPPPPPPEPPDVSFTASDIILEDGDPVTLTWDVKNADSCKGIGFLPYGKMSDTVTFRPSQTITYGLTCSGAGGTVSKSIEVAVVPIAGVGVTLQASSVDITSNDSIELTWASINTSSCEGSNFSASGTGGTVTVSPDATTVYRIDCINSTTGIGAYDTVTVHVTYVEEDSGPPDTTPPVISDGTPTGTFSATTTSVTLGVATDEKAACKYSLFAGTTFENMTAFSVSNATTHTVTINNLLPNAQYKYYVRCEDEAGNENTVDYPIQFVIGNP